MENHRSSPWELPESSAMHSAVSIPCLLPPCDEDNHLPAIDNKSAASQPITDHSPSTIPLVHPRSCTCCRQRKVRCDRKNPCSCCVRSKLECTYPPGPGRAGKRPLNILNSQVVDRLHSLEAIIKRLTAGHNITGSSGSATASQTGEELTHTLDTLGTGTSIEPQLARLIVEGTHSHYISNILWANLANEIEELRDMLYEPASDDESCTPGQSSTSNLSSVLQPITTVLGFPILPNSMRAYHPPLFQSVALLSVFTENVLPLVHIVHMPTTSRLYWDAIESLDSLDKNTEALLFAIYYSAILSADPERRESLLGMSSSAAVETYRFAVEQAIAKADLLNTRSIILLQAVVLFLSALRNEDDSRSAWSLIPLVLRVAQAMGLHRDGTIFALKPLEVEVRRRLWYHICLLDIRSSEYHGYEPIIHEATFDTRLPLNVNDSDLNHQMINPPPKREGPTEMTFCLIRCEAMRVGWKVGYAPPSLRVPSLAGDGLSLKARESLVEDLNRRLEEQFLRHCDISQTFQRFYTVVARLIIARTRLVVLYPAAQKNSCASSLSVEARDQLFSISLDVLELSNTLLTDKDLAKWAWHGKTHVQWHAIAFILSEICTRPQSVECERAWQCVTMVLDGWQDKRPDKKGSLWGPVKRLMTKARYVRELQKSDILSNDQYVITPANLLSERSGEDMQTMTYPLLKSPAITPDSMAANLSSYNFRSTSTIETSDCNMGPTLGDLDIDSLATWWMDTSIIM